MIKQDVQPKWMTCVELWMTYILTKCGDVKMYGQFVTSDPLQRMVLNFAITNLLESAQQKFKTIHR